MQNPYRSAPRWVRLASYAFVAVLGPLCFLGPGTDLDAGAVLWSGRRILDGSYVASRAPGAPVHEALVGVLDLLGSWAPNALSLVAALVLCAALFFLLDREDSPHAWLAVGLVAANPWFQIASSSTTDFVLASSLLVCGAVACRRDRAVLAGVLCGLSIGVRMSGALFVVALVIADGTGRSASRARAGRLLLVAGAVGALAFVPSYFAASRSLDFARNDFETAEFGVHVGRAFMKNVAYTGPLMALLMIAALPALWALRTMWSERFLVRFSALGFVLGQVLFVRFPWKIGHLLPSMICLAILLAEALRNRRRLLVALVVAQLSLGLVNIEFARPNTPNAATDATFDLRVRPGPLLVDTRCRVDDVDAARSLDVERIDAVWNCAKPFGSGR